MNFVKILLKQKGININVKDGHLYYLILIDIISYFMVKFGVYSK